MEIAEQIKAGRARLGLTQDELAQKVYVSRQTISSWENNKTYPDVQSLMLLSQTFGISIDDLVKGDVTRMKERLEQDVKTLNSYGMGITLTVVAATIAIFATTWQDKHGWSLGQQIPTMLIAVIACIALAYCVAKTERIKHDHDLQTFREISDFMDGKRPSPTPRCPSPSVAAFRELSSSSSPGQSVLPSLNCCPRCSSKQDASERIREPRRNTPPDPPNWRSSARHRQL